MPKSFLYFFSLNGSVAHACRSSSCSGHHIVVEAGDLDAAAAILHLREHLREHERRVGDRAAERARVQVGAAAAQVDLEVDQAAQAVADRRHAAREHRRVGDDDDVGVELVLVGADEVVEVGAADFLLAFEDELHVHRQAAVLLQVRLDRLEVHEHLALVVGRRRARRSRRRGSSPRTAATPTGSADRPAARRSGRRTGSSARPARRASRRRRPDCRACRSSLHVLQADAAHLVGAPLGAALARRRRARAAR